MFKFKNTPQGCGRFVKNCQNVKCRFRKYYSFTNKDARTLPREITWSDGRLLQNPLPEFVDNSMVEIYINDGEYVMTSRFYFPEESGKAMKDDGNREFSFYRRKMPVILTSTGFLC